jgi:hypothetical protein
MLGGYARPLADASGPPFASEKNFSTNKLMKAGIDKHDQRLDHANASAAGSPKKFQNSSERTDESAKTHV